MPSLQSLNPLRSRAGALLILLALNPALWLWNRGGDVYPDTVAYLTFARDLVESGRLVLAGWEHVNGALILPPLYPALVALLRPLAGDPLVAAYAVSRLALLATTIPMFLLVERAAGRPAALVTTAAVQLTAAHALHGALPLTESLFLLTTFVALLVLAAWPAARRPGWAGVGLGAAAASVFLSRQIGLVVIAFVVAWVGVQALSKVRGARRVLAGAGLGLVLVLGPYAGLVWAQAGAHPFQQHLRVGAYDAGVEPALAAEVARTREARRAAVSDYQELLALRRELRALIPAGTEMYAEVRAPTVAEARPLERVVSAIARPGDWLGRLAGNLRHLSEALGPSVLVLFLLSTAAAVRWPRVGTPAGRGAAFVAGAFLVAYLLVVSLLTDRVARYVTVLAPLMLTQAGIGVALGLRRAGRARARGAWVGAVAAGALALVAVSDLRSVRAVPRKPIVPASARPIADLRRRVPSGQPVFAIHPWPAYLAGGTWRVLPNDTLERVVGYARRTGVDWLLVTDGPEDERARNRNLGWFDTPHLERVRPELVELAAASPDGRARLYRVRPARAAAGPSEVPSPSIPAHARRHP